MPFAPPKAEALKCPTCGVERRLVRIACTGVANGARIELVGIPTYGCAHLDHPRKWYHGDLGCEVTELLCLDVAFPFPRHSIFGSNCRRRGERVSRAERRVVRLEREITVSEVPGVRATIEAAGLTCTACGEVQFSSLDADANALAEALRLAFEHGGLHP